jgi:excisionase family DNA binding protein
VVTDEELLSPSQAARLAQLSSERIRQLADCGALPATKTALGRLYRRADIEALIEKRAGALPA